MLNITIELAKLEEPHPVSVFKVQVTMNGADVPMPIFKARLLCWLLTVVFVLSGVAGFERGKRNRQLHMQGCFKIRFPDDKESCPFLRKTTYDTFPARPKGGYKASVDALSYGQTFELACGYCMKDWNLARFVLVAVGLSERDCAIFRAMYGGRCESHLGDRDLLYKPVQHGLLLVHAVAPTLDHRPVRSSG